MGQCDQDKVEQRMCPVVYQVTTVTTISCRYAQTEERESLLWFIISEGLGHNHFVQISQWQERVTEEVFHLMADRKQGRKIQEEARTNLAPKAMPKWHPTSDNALMLRLHQGISTLTTSAPSCLIVSGNMIRHTRSPALGSPTLSHLYPVMLSVKTAWHDALKNHIICALKAAISQSHLFWPAGSEVMALKCTQNICGRALCPHLNVSVSIAPPLIPPPAPCHQEAKNCGICMISAVSLGQAVIWKQLKLQREGDFNRTSM